MDGRVADVATGQPRELEWLVHDLAVRGQDGHLLEGDHVRVERR